MIDCEKPRLPTIAWYPSFVRSVYKEAVTEPSLFEQLPIEEALHKVNTEMLEILTNLPG